MKAAEQEIRDLLRQRHKLQGFQEDDFWIRNLSEMLQAEEASSRVLTMLLAAIASVSLMVGGIGIMNIMLVSVTERTREIGLRMAVGARGRDIRTQFLVEAVTLSLTGGIIGIGIGLGGSYAIAYFAEWRTLINPRGHPPRLRLLRHRRHLLRLLPRPEGARAQSHRGAEVRMTGRRALLARRRPPSRAGCPLTAPPALAQTYTPQSAVRAQRDLPIERVGSGRVILFGDVRNGSSTSYERVVLLAEGLDEAGRGGLAADAPTSAAWCPVAGTAPFECRIPSGGREKPLPGHRRGVPDRRAEPLTGAV